VHYDGDEDGHELAQLLLQPDGQALEQGVEGECDDQEDGAQGRVVEEVGAVAVAVVLEPIASFLNSLAENLE
jgi:hypothetical protein